MVVIITSMVDTNSAMVKDIDVAVIIPMDFQGLIIYITKYPGICIA